MRKLFYCSTVWSNTVNNIKTLQGAQNFACRIITGTRKFDNITLALQELNWPPIKQLLLDRDSITTFKCMKGLAPSYLRATDQKYRESDDRIVISYFGFSPKMFMWWTIFKNHIFNFRRFFVFLKIAKVEKLVKSPLGSAGNMEKLCIFGKLARNNGNYSRIIANCVISKSSF